MEPIRAVAFSKHAAVAVAVAVAEHSSFEMEH